MCGIAGYIGQGNKEALQKMSESMNHRGPDAHGEYVGKGFGLAHARLSIVDLTETGKQPMFNSDETIGIVFNGEIYNFRELRQELESDGYIFKGTSDTEVILALYQKEGEKVFSKIHGMFALGIVDVSQQKLILARDRAGKKPLYWSQLTPQSLVFASELLTLQKHPAWSTRKPKISQASLAQYVVNDYVPTPSTIFEGVFKLEPATYMRVSLIDFTCEKISYWNLCGSHMNNTFKVDTLDTLISESVKRRLIADVPVGVFLSGGLDSSTVAYYAAKHVQPSQIKTFSIGFNEKSFDESEYAYCVAQHLNTEHHHKIITSRDCITSLKDIFSKLDEPIGDASIIPTYLVSQFARKHVTVALGGDGGDELFAGYPTFLAESIYSRIVSVIPRSILDLIFKVIKILISSVPASYTNFSLTFKLQKFIEGHVQNISERHARYLGSFSKEELADLLRIPSEASTSDVYSNSERYISEFVLDSESGDLSGEDRNPSLNALLYMYFRTYLLDLVLVKVDRATMMNSLEARSPLLDTALVEYAFSLPYSVKKHYTTLKWALKTTMKGKLPSRIINRPKKGFGLPISEWINGDMKHLVERYFSEQYINRQGLFNAEYISKIIQQHQNREYNHRKKIWTLLAFQMWWDTHVKNNV